MPPRRSGRAPGATQRVAIAGTPSMRAQSSDLSDDEDPLALTPLPRPTQVQKGTRSSTKRRQPGSTQAGPPSSAAQTPARISNTQSRTKGSGGKRDVPKDGKRVSRGGDGGLIWGGEGDLVPPSDEEEFEEWVSLRAAEKARKEKGKGKEREHDQGEVTWRSSGMSSSLPQASSQVSSPQRNGSPIRRQITIDADLNQPGPSTRPQTFLNGLLQPEFSHFPTEEFPRLFVDEDSVFSSQGIEDEDIMGEPQGMILDKDLEEEASSREGQAEDVIMRTSTSVPVDDYGQQWELPRTGIGDSVAREPMEGQHEPEAAGGEPWMDLDFPIASDDRDEPITTMSEPIINHTTPVASTQSPIPQETPKTPPARSLATAQSPKVPSQVPRPSPSAYQDSQEQGNRMISTALPRLHSVHPSVLYSSPVTPFKPSQADNMPISPSSPTVNRTPIPSSRQAPQSESPDVLALSSQRNDLPSFHRHSGFNKDADVSSNGDQNSKETRSVSLFAQPQSIRPILQDTSTPSPSTDLVESRQVESALTPLPMAFQTVSPGQFPPVHVQPAAPADPALEQFRSARTFRTRTILQLQPYTRERQMYEAALRKGGLKPGKHIVAPVREITPDEEESSDNPDPEVNAPSSSSVNPSQVLRDEEAIVIGNTPPPRPQREKRTPKPVEPADLDDFFVEYGRDADDDDEKDMKLLQKIVRSRLKAEKEERKRLRMAEKDRRAFEKLIGDHEASGDDARIGGGEPSTHSRKPPKKNPGSTKTAVTYGKSKQRRSSLLGSGTDNESIPELPPPLSAFRTSTPSMSASTSSAPSLRPPLSPISDNAQDAHRDIYDNGSFFIDDIPHRSPRTKDISSDGSDESDEDDTPHADKRAKIARKMMPAAMLRRLEQEAAEKERRKAEQNRRKQRRNGTLSPAKPGRAITKRGGGDGAGKNVDFADFIKDDGDPSSSASEVGEDIPALPAPLSPSYGSGIGDAYATPIVLDDYDDSSSQAEEDNNAGTETLARLYEGDYESIATGNQFVQQRFKAKRSKWTNRDRYTGIRRFQSRRPAVQLLRSGKSSRRDDTGRTHRDRDGPDKNLVQSRLDFPREDSKHNDRCHSTGKKRSRQNDHRSRSNHTSKSRPGKPRPAIKLDDHVIFANADFAFDSDREIGHTTWNPRQLKASASTSRKVGRPGGRVAHDIPTSVVIRQPSPDHVDTGIGKAKSWANFDKFSVDFDISPLPSGLYCDPRSIVGSGQIARTIARLSGISVDPEDIDPVVDVYDLHLRMDDISETFGETCAVYFERLWNATLAYVNDTERGRPDFAGLRFFADLRYYSPDQSIPLEVSTFIGNEIRRLVSKLENIPLPTSKRESSAREALLDLGVQLLDLACNLPDSDAGSLLELCGTTLLRALLTAGFDKTIKPLKNILRGESVTGEIRNHDTIIWIAAIQLLSKIRKPDEAQDMFLLCLEKVLDSLNGVDQVGPMAAERIWFLIFGICALSQFDPNGHVKEFVPQPRWPLVRRAVSLIKISHNEEAEERAHLDQLQGRDRYTKIMMARCIRLSSIWKWSFDRESFSVATKDLGVIFKDRQYRNLPTEPPVDYPSWITSFDISQTASPSPDHRRETAFDLYLRLVCVAASDIIETSESLSEAQQAEKDVQRLIMSITPVSPVKFNRILPPSPRQLGQLVNRYSTIIAACYFSPGLISWLLANAKKWAPFELADIDSRQISIRGLMYLGVALRHHQASLKVIVNRLAEILGVLQGELDDLNRQHHHASGTGSITTGGAGTTITAVAPSKIEVQRMMVLVVTCFRQIILHHSFDPEQKDNPVYPDPCLLDQSWTGKIFELSAQDPRSGLEIVATIQAFLDARSFALPRKARLAREERLESQDEYGSLGFELDEITIQRLGGGGNEEDPIEKMDEGFANIVENEICPRIYRLLSDLLPAVVGGPENGRPGEDRRQELRKYADVRDTYLLKLTRCWSDCAAVVVVEHRRLDWSTFIGSFGRQSWSRLGDAKGRTQVGLQFMLNVAKLDPSSFTAFAEDYIALLFETIVTDRLSIEHQYLSAVISMPGATSHPILAGVEGIPSLSRESAGETNLSEQEFMDLRPMFLDFVLSNMSRLFADGEGWGSKKKPLLYRLVNLLVSSMVSNEKSIDTTRVIHHQSYLAFVNTVIRSLEHHLGLYITPASVPGLKHFQNQHQSV